MLCDGNMDLHESERLVSQHTHTHMQKTGNWSFQGPRCLKHEFLRAAPGAFGVEHTCVVMWRVCTRSKVRPQRATRVKCPKHTSHLLTSRRSRVQIKKCSSVPSMFLYLYNVWSCKSPRIWSVSFERQGKLMDNVRNIWEIVFSRDGRHLGCGVDPVALLRSDWLRRVLCIFTGGGLCSVKCKLVWDFFYTFHPNSSACKRRIN